MAQMHHAATRSAGIIAANRHIGARPDRHPGAAVTLTRRDGTLLHLASISAWVERSHAAHDLPSTVDIAKSGDVIGRLTRLFDA